VGLTLPRIESRWLPVIDSGLSPVAAVVVYSSIASGVMALTGVVFSLVFVMVQFSAIAYSPRLVLWIVRDRVLWHSLGVFTATFLYSLAAIAWLDRKHSGNVPFFSGWLVILLLLASVAMLVALIGRISLFQIRSTLSFGWQEQESLANELTLPIALISIECAFHGRPVYVTLWRPDGTGLLVYSDMHDSAERRELGSCSVVMSSHQ
jgi:predicted membrane protein DUF2254